MPVTAGAAHDRRHRYRRHRYGRGRVPQEEGATVTSRRITAAVTLAAVVLLAGCGGSGPTAPAGPAATPRSPGPTQGPPAPGEPAGGAATPAPPATDVPPGVDPAPGADVAPTAGTAPPGPCLDPASPLVTGALAALGDTAPGPSPWVAGAASDATVPCPDLLWLTAETPGGTASSPTHVLFFHDGRFLGTATSDAYAYTRVVEAHDATVSVQYRWLAPDDAHCCPSGGPAVVDYTWDGGQVVMRQPLPPEMVASYGG